MLSRIRKAREDEGFTLIELLVVIMIIGILSAIAVPTFLGQRTKGYEKAAMAALASMAIAQESIKTETGSYADLTTGATALAENGYAVDNAVVTVAQGSSTAAAYCYTAVHRDGGRTFVIRHNATSPAAGTCGA